MLLLSGATWPSKASRLPAADSLLQALRSAPSDTVRAKTALRLSAALAPTDTARARHYARHALALSTRTGFAYGQAHSWLQLSALAIIRNDNDRARRYGQLAQRAAAALPRSAAADGRTRRLLAAIANNRGNVADRQGRYEAATQFYLQAVSHLAGTAEVPTTLTVYANLGNSFQALNQPEQAAAYWGQAVALGRATGPVPELAPVYLQLAALQLQQARPDSAWQLLRAAYPIIERHPFYAGEYYGTLGQYYLGRQLPQPARQAFRRALPYATTKGALGYQAKILFNLGQAEAQLGDLSQARATMQRSLALTQQLGDAQQLISNLAALAHLEEQAGQWQQALYYYRRGQQLRDTLAGAAVQARVRELETRFRTRQQAQQLQALRRERAAQQQALLQQRRLSMAYLGLALAALGAGGLLGLLLRHRQRLARQQRELQAQRIRQLEQEKQLLSTTAMLQGQEEERRRLARDLHDGLGGMLSTVKLYLGTVRGRVVLSEEAAALFAQSVDHLDSSISELRRVARNMMPEALLTFGLPQALQDLCAAAQQAGGLQVHLQTYGLEARLDHATEVALYRLVQELLNNVLKHAQARQVLVQLMRHHHDVQLVVEDDGRGFDPNGTRMGVGLRSMQARADYLGGTLDVRSGPGQGTAVSLDFRVPPPTAPA
ncbi:hypothetical protein GCM10027175_10750 [Hymenobacter latericoloratus]